MQAHRRRNLSRRPGLPHQRPGRHFPGDRQPLPGARPPREAAVPHAAVPRGGVVPGGLPGGVRHRVRRGGHPGPARRGARPRLPQRGGGGRPGRRRAAAPHRVPDVLSAQRLEPDGLHEQRQLSDAVLLLHRLHQRCLAPQADSVTAVRAPPAAPLSDLCISFNVGLKMVHASCRLALLHEVSV